MAVGVFGACRVDASVEVKADRGGGGRVEIQAVLDAAAVAQLGGATPEKRLALDDLRAAGWNVARPTRQPDGGLEVAASQDFDDPQEAEILLEEVAGPGGPLQDIALRQERSFLKTVTSFAATVDLEDRLGAFTDPALRQALAGPNGEALGVSDTQLERRFGAPVDQMFGLHVVAALPGDPQANVPTKANGHPQWSPAFGAVTQIEARSEVWNVRNLVAAGAGAGAAVGLVALFTARLRRQRSGAAPPFDQDLEGP